ncbi:MAG: peptide deformylase [Clostridiales Family XIII bacterium]|jgi:peptide deformylase|nr:peptide deformylase [Clostridiales Family XIII bacterium]
MALRNIVTEEDEILRKQSRVVMEITDRTRTLVEDMWDTLDAAKGVGLAAPQVGVLRRIFVIDVTPPPEVDEDGAAADHPAPAGHPKEERELDEPENYRWTMINPEILWISDETVTESEGCLSVPGVTGNVERPAAVLISAIDEDGDEYQVKAEGLFAKAFFHELDHLNGVLFTDKASDIKEVE